jgi:hypothetical protein
MGDARDRGRAPLLPCCLFDLVAFLFIVVLGSGFGHALSDAAFLQEGSLQRLYLAAQ